MTKIIEPIKGGVSGEILAPPDKSISHRALILGAIAEGVSEISNLLIADDVMATVACLRQLGVEIEINGEDARLVGRGLWGLTKPQDALDCGNSGTTMRLLAGVLAGQPFDSVLTGDASLRARPMGRIIEPLELMGARIDSEGGFAPLTIHGAKLTGINYHVPMQSAQVKSAVQLAGLFAKGQTTVSGADMARKHTEIMIRNMRVKGKLVGQKINVPGDVSSAAFFVVLGLLHAAQGLRIKNVGFSPTRIGIIGALKAMGGDIVLEAKAMEGGEPVGDIIVKKSTLTGIDVNENMAAMMIDEIAILAVAAAFARGRSSFTGLAELRLKESDRLNAIVSELSKIGVDIRLDGEGMIIEGGKPIKGALLDSHSDHRIAMSLAIAATCACSPTEIQNADVVNVSFPNFFEILTSIIGDNVV